MPITQITADVIADGTVVAAEIADNAITLAKMAGGTDGNIISYDASGDPVAIATGNDGQVLTSTGAGSPPAFETAAAGGGSWTLISSVTASTSATIDFLSDMSSTYDAYVATFNNVVVASDTARLGMRIALSGAARSTAGDYKYCYHGRIASGTDDHNNSTGDSRIRFHDGTGTGTGEGISGNVWVYHPSSTNIYKFVTFNCSVYGHTPDFRTYTGGGMFDTNTEAWTGIQFLTNTGNITSGEFYLYGIGNS